MGPAGASSCAVSYLLPLLPNVLWPADVSSLQQPDGSFWGDEWGETDTRFSYCALSVLWLLDRLDAIDVQQAARYVAACKNFDGGFGCTPGVLWHWWRSGVCSRQRCCNAVCSSFC